MGKLLCSETIDDDGLDTPADAGSGHRRRSCQRWIRVALTFGVFVVFCVSPVVQNGDSLLAAPTAYSIVHHRTLAVDEFDSKQIRHHYGVAVFEGHRYDFFPWPTALWAIPAVVTLDAAHAVGV